MPVTRRKAPPPQANANSSAASAAVPPSSSSTSVSSSAPFVPKSPPLAPLPAALHLPSPIPVPSSNASSLIHSLGESLSRYPPLFNADCKLLLVPSGFHVRVYSIATGLCLFLLTGHTGEVTSVLLHPLLKLRCFTASLDGFIKEWDLHTGTCLKSTDLHMPIVNAVISSHWTQDSIISAASSSSSVPLHPTDDMIFINANPHSSKRSRHPSRQPAQVARSHRILSFHYPSGQCSTLYKARACVALALSPTLEYLATIANHVLTLYHLASRTRIKCKHTRNLTCVAFHPIDPYLATGDDRGMILLWYQYERHLLSDSYTSSGNRATGGPDDDDDEEEMGEEQQEDDEVANELKHKRRKRTEQQLVSSSRSASSSAPVAVQPVVSTLHWHAHAVASLAFTHDGTYLLSGGEEAVLVIWQLASGTKQFISRLLGAFTSIIISPNNMLYATSHTDNAIRVLSATTSKIIVHLQGSEMAHEMVLPHKEVKKLAPLLLPAFRTFSSLSSSAALSSACCVLMRGRPGFLQLYDVWQDQHVLDMDVTQRNLVSRTDDVHMSHYRVEQACYQPLHQEWLCTVERRTDVAPISMRQTLRFWRYEPRVASSVAAAPSLTSLYASSAPSAIAAPVAPYSLHTRIDSPHKEVIVDLAFHPLLPVLVTVAADRSFKIWQLLTRQKERTVGETMAQERLAASSSSTASIPEPKGVDTYWSCAALGFYRDLHPSVLAFSPDGDTLAVAFGQVLTVWELNTPSPADNGAISLTLLRTLLHASPIHHLGFVHPAPSPSSSSSASFLLLLTATTDSMHAWNASTGQLLASRPLNVSGLKCHDSGLVAVTAWKLQEKKTISKGSNKTSAPSDSSLSSSSSSSSALSTAAAAVTESASMFDQIRSTLLLFKTAESLQPFRVFSMHDLRLERINDAYLVLKATMCFVKAPQAISSSSADAAVSASDYPSLLYVDRQKRLVRLDRLEDPWWLSVKDKNRLQAVAAAANKDLLSEPDAHISLFEQMYGKPAAVAIGSRGSSSTPASSSSLVAAKSFTPAALFDAPSHLLPAMDKLVVPYLDFFLQPRLADSVVDPSTTGALTKTDEDTIVQAAESKRDKDVPKLSLSSHPICSFPGAVHLDEEQLSREVQEFLSGSDPYRQRLVSAFQAITLKESSKESPSTTSLAQSNASIAHSDIEKRAQDEEVEEQDKQQQAKSAVQIMNGLHSDHEEQSDSAPKSNIKTKAKSKARASAPSIPSSNGITKLHEQIIVDPESKTISETHVEPKSSKSSKKAPSQNGTHRHQPESAEKEKSSNSSRSKRAKIIN